MLKLILLVIIAILLFGCATDSMHRYDENAIKQSGIINSKEEIQNWEEFRDDTLLLPVAGIFIPVQLGSPSKEGNDFRYVVQISEDQAMPIISKYSGFEVGECVTVFLSQSMPPRIAHGGECR
jgi:hypothetical protein